MADPITAPNGFQLGQTRVFVQPDGSYPDAAYKFQGCLNLAESEQDLGELTPVYCPSTEQPNKWDIVDTIVSAPGLPTVDFTQRMARDLRDIWLTLAERGCEFNMIQKIFCDGRPDDFNTWDGKWLMLGGRMTARTLPQANPLSGEDNAQADLTGSITYRSLIRILRLVFGSKGESTVVSEILDGFYYDAINCGNCGATPSDGCQKQYWLAAASGGSPGLSSRIVYSVDGGATFGQLNITPLGGTDARRIAAMGQYLVGVTINSGGGHFYSTFADIDAGTTNFALVTSGYTTAPRAIYAKSPSEAFIAAAGGYIFFLSEPTGTPTVLTDGSLTAQSLNDIHGHGNTIVAVGAANAVVYSINGGESFATVTGPAVAVTLNSVRVLPSGVWWVGDAAGNLWWTRNNGVTWRQKSYGSGNNNILDMWWVDSNVGYIAAATGAAGKIYSTHDAGYTWQLASSTDRRLQGVPTALRYNVVTGCGYNVVGIGGAKTAGGDGVIAIAE